MRQQGHLPRWIYIPATIGLAVVIIPLLALLPRVEWATFWQDITEPTVASALLLSAKSALVAVLVCIVLGVPLAVLIARAPQTLATVLRTIVTLPLVLPPLVGGVALLAVLGRNGALGSLLEGWGISVAFTPAAVVVAQTFVAMPFLVISVEGALRSTGVEYENVATGLGAGRTRVLTRVTLPLILPALAAGTVLAFARSLGEFGATALLAGNRPGVTQTIPMAIYTAFNGVGTSRQAAMALSVLLVATALVVLLFFPAARGGMPQRGVNPAQSSDAPLTLPQPDKASRARGLPLHAQVEHTRPGFTLNAALSVPAGEVLAVIGPNGAGKSTLMNLISGSLAPTKGHVEVGGSTLVGDGVNTPSNKRPIGVLNQQPRLFPHMNLEANVAFGMRAQGETKRVAHEKARHLLNQVGLGTMARRKPATLSGGQQQRVALMRTLATNPAVLILDEPLAALDITSTPIMRQIIAHQVQSNAMTALLITHDPLDVLWLAHTVMVMDAGTVVEKQVVSDFFARPGSGFGAAFTGVNALPRDGAVVHATQTELVICPTSSAAGGWQGTVNYVEVVGGKGVVHVDIGGWPVRVACDVSEVNNLITGQQVQVLQRSEITGGSNES